jgi:hypothetical protein
MHSSTKYIDAYLEEKLVGTGAFGLLTRPGLSSHPQTEPSTLC